MEDPGTAPKANRIRRHLSWVVPLALAPVAYVGCLVAYNAIEQGEPADGSTLLVLLLLTLGAVVVPLVLIVIAIVNASATYRDHRRGTGRLNAAELVDIRRRDASSRAWRDAQVLRSQLLAHEVPATLSVWDVVPYANEEFFCDVPIGYARYYGMDVTYAQTSGFFYGRPSFVIAGLAATAISNAAQRNAARNRAREQWREHCIGRLVVSNHRLLLQVRGRWLTFDYSTMTAVFPEPASWGLVCQFSGAEPLLLTGDHAPFVAVMTLYRTHGERALREHPGLAPLAVGG